MIDLSQLLNKEQYEAATAPDGPLLILAAAGTGKTRTLVYRVVNLIQRGYRCENILLLTFTNKAAREMLERVDEVIPGMASGIWGGTFHHVANKILRRHSTLIGYQNNFTIIDTDDQKTLMSSCIKELGYSKKDFTKKEVILSILSSSINNGKTYEEYLDEHSDTYLSSDIEKIKDVLSLYIKRKFESNCMDFDDLLSNVLQLLKENESVREYYQNRFSHILVDEYQDTNKLQAEFVNILACKHRNISVVGDDFQCIYSWRGSDYRNIMDFAKVYEGAKIVKLEQNYRSTPEILNIANESIVHNYDQFPKVLRATNEKGEMPVCFKLQDESNQAVKILEIVQKCVSYGYQYSDIAILYRSHYQSLPIQMEFSRSKIPFLLTSGLGFFESAHCKDILSFYRLLVSDKDFLAFSRCLSLLYGAGESLVTKMWQKLGGKFDASDDASRNMLLTSLPQKVRDQWAGIDKAIERYFNDKSSKNVYNFLNDILDAFYITYLKRSFENADDRIDDLYTLPKEISKRDSLEAFLEDIALLTNVDEISSKANDNQVLLGTIHQAKGLEWPVVIIPNLAEEYFPSVRALESHGDDTEERRLFYVAVTRARERLYFTYPALRGARDNNYQYPVMKSRFLREVPESLYQEINLCTYDNGSRVFNGRSIGGFGNKKFNLGGVGNSGGFNPNVKFSGKKIQW